MDAARFDTLARLIGSRTSRRMAIGLAAAGLLSITAPDAEALRCNKANPCPECRRCRRRRCKPDATKNGTDCTGGKCQSGVCTPTSACTPACTGGRECQSNGTCACPPDKPHVAPQQFCDETCRACCTAGDCEGSKECRHDLGSICVCPEGLHFCDGLCWSCCETEDCVGGRHHADGFICNVNHACACQEGRTACDQADGTGQFCASLQDDEFNCGTCGSKCGEWVCVNGGCTPP